MKCSLAITALLFLTLVGCLGPTLPAPTDSPPPSAQASVNKADEDWVLIDSRTDRLTVFVNGSAPAVFENIAVGAAGVKEKRHVGDDVTPRGTYTVGWLQPHSRFVHFIGLTYPSRTDAARGYQEGVIDQHTYERIVSALDRGQLPPQDTRLGGLIGIHGVGSGSIEIHRIANWTAGCIAVDNDQIRRLFKILRRGMRVEIT
jgi:murein L,D-transpeptidase YafK